MRANIRTYDAPRGNESIFLKVPKVRSEATDSSYQLVDAVFLRRRGGHPNRAFRDAVPIQQSLVVSLSPHPLAYWAACDGSLRTNIMCKYRVIFIIRATTVRANPGFPNRVRAAAAATGRRTGRPCSRPPAREPACLFNQLDHRRFPKSWIDGVATVFPPFTLKVEGWRRVV